MGEFRKTYDVEFKHKAIKMFTVIFYKVNTVDQDNKLDLIINKLQNIESVTLIIMR